MPSTLPPPECIPSSQWGFEAKVNIPPSGQGQLWFEPKHFLFQRPICLSTPLLKPCFSGFPLTQIMRAARTCFQKSLWLVACRALLRPEQWDQYLNSCTGVTIPWERVSVASSAGCSTLFKSKKKKKKEWGCTSVRCYRQKKSWMPLPVIPLLGFSL